MDFIYKLSTYLRVLYNGIELIMSYCLTIFLLDLSRYLPAAPPPNELIEINSRIAELKKMSKYNNQGNGRNKKLNCEFKI